MKKRLLCAVLVLVAAASQLSGCRDEKISTSGIETIAPKTLTVCTDFPYAPFDLEKDGIYSGIDIDLMRAVGDDLRYKVIIKPTVFDGIFDAMNSGQCDVVASAVSISDERKKTMLFSDGYFEVSQSLLVRRTVGPDETHVLSIGHTVGVQSGTTGETLASTIAGGAAVKGYDSVDDLYAALDSGEINGVINDFPVNSYRAQQDPSLSVAQTFNDVNREQYGVAMPLASERLRAAINASLKRILDDGRYDEILGHYLGSATDLGA